MKKKSDKLKLIYILGNSHSGSTVLSFYIGSFKEVFAGGELKRYAFKPYKRVCTCGKKLSLCPFWKHMDIENNDYVKKNTFKRSAGNSFFRTIFGRFGKFREDKNLEWNFQKALRDHMHSFNPRFEYLLDSSKSLDRLLFLESMDEMDMKIIYLHRNFQANLASFIKRGSSFWLGYFRLKVNNLFIKNYIKKTKTPLLNISYESFVNNNEEELKRISEFLNISFSDRTQNLNEVDFHVFTGNTNTREQFKTQNHKLKLSRNSDVSLSKFQKFIMSIFGEF